MEPVHRAKLMHLAHAAILPRNRGVVNSEGEVTLMFSDMAGYTAMTERLGDRAALEIVQAHNEIVRRECEALLDLLG